MKIKFANNTEIDTLKIERYEDTEKIKYVSFRIPIAIKTKYGKIKLKSINLTKDGKLEKGTLGEYFTFKLSDVTINVEPSEIIIFETTGILRKIVFTTPKTIKTKVGALTFSTYIFVSNNHTLAFGNIKDVQTVDTKFGKLRIKENVEFNSQGDLNYYVLAEPTIIDTPIGKYEVLAISYEYNHNIDKFILGNNNIIDLPNIKAEFTSIQFRNGIFTGGELTDQATIKTAIGELTLEHEIKFNKNGSFKSGDLAKPTTIDIPIGKLDLIGYIVMYDNNIKSCTLNSNTTLKVGKRNIEFYKGSLEYISFDEEGNLIRGFIRSTQVIKTKIGDIPIYGYTEFHKNGNLKKIDLNVSCKIKTKVGTLLVRDNIEFYENEKLKKCTLEERKIIKDKLFPSGDTLIWNKDGNFSGRQIYYGE